MKSLDAETTYQAAVRLMPAQQSIELQYLRTYRRLPDLKRPKTFNEKIQRRKLFGKDARYAVLTDKVRVKELVAGGLGAIGSSRRCSMVRPCRRAQSEPGRCHTY